MSTSWRMTVTQSLLAALVPITLAGCWAIGGKPAAQGEPIRVGLTTSLSGATALLGEGTKRGAEMAIDEFNARGGYHGRPVRLVIYDDGTKPDRSVEAVKKLLNDDKVCAILGPANTGNAMAHLAMVQEAGIPELIPGATGAKIATKFAGANNCIFHVSTVDSGQVKTMLAWLVDHKKLARIGLLHDESGYGKAGRDEVLAQLQQRGMAPVAVAGFPANADSLAAPLASVMAAQPDALIAYCLGPDYATLIRQMDESRANVPLMGAWLAGDPTVKHVVGPIIERGVYTISSFAPDMNDKAKAFHEKVVKRYGEDIFPMPTAQGYDAGQMLCQALAKAGPEPHALRDAIEALDDFHGVTAAPTHPFSPDNHRAITAEAMFVQTYHDGTFGKATH